MQFPSSTVQYISLQYTIYTDPQQHTLIHLVDYFLHILNALLIVCTLVLGSIRRDFFYIATNVLFGVYTVNKCAEWIN